VTKAYGDRRGTPGHPLESDGFLDPCLPDSSDGPADK
jgi:hypothetical protein